MFGHVHLYDSINYRCVCQHCEHMQSAIECVCCQEIPKIKDLIEECEGIECITSHPGFAPSCLNETVLKIAYYSYRQQYAVNLPDTPEYVSNMYNVLVQYQ